MLRLLALSNSDREVYRSIINIVGPPLGKVSLVPHDFPDDGLHNRFLAYAMLTDSVIGRVTSKAKATAGQYNIGVNMCRHLLPVPIPPTNEQRRIVEKIDCHLPIELLTEHTGLST